MSRQAEVIDELTSLGISSETDDSRESVPLNGASRLPTTEEAVVDQRKVITKISSIADQVSGIAQEVRGQLREIDERLRRLDIKLASVGENEDGESVP